MESVDGVFGCRNDRSGGIACSSSAHVVMDVLLPCSEHARYVGAVFSAAVHLHVMFLLGCSTQICSVWFVGGGFVCFHDCTCCVCVFTAATAVCQWQL